MKWGKFLEHRDDSFHHDGRHRDFRLGFVGPVADKAFPTGFQIGDISHVVLGNVRA